MELLFNEGQSERLVGNFHVMRGIGLAAELD